MPKKATGDRVPADYGTPELARRFSVVPKLNGAYTYGAKVMDDTEIDRLLMKDRINPTQHSILQAFASRLEQAGYNGVKAIDYNATHHSEPHTMGDRMHVKVSRAIYLRRAMVDHEKIGRGRDQALVSLVSEDMPWPGNDASLHEAIDGLQQILTRRLA